MKNNKPSDTTKETLKVLLTDYLHRRGKFGVISDYDSTMQGVRAAYKVKISSIDKTLIHIAKEIFEIVDRGFFLFQVIEWKIEYLVKALIHAIETSNPMSLANNTRSLIEHIASLVGVGIELEKLENNLSGQQSKKTINDSLRRTRKYLQQVYYGENQETSKGRNEKAIHVNDLLRAFKKEISNIGEMYDFLCEFVHPNYGSNLLVSSGVISSGRLNPPEEFHQDILNKLRRICSFCMVYLQNHAIGYSTVPARLFLFLDRCFVPGARLNNAFSIRAPKPQGDGLSKKTALYFQKARTINEAIQLTYAYLESNGYSLIGAKEIKCTEDEFIYNIHHTSRGKIWVKMQKMDTF